MNTLVAIRWTDARPIRVEGSSAAEVVERAAMGQDGAPWAARGPPRLEQIPRVVNAEVGRAQAALSAGQAQLKAVNTST